MSFRFENILSFDLFCFSLFSYYFNPGNIIKVSSTKDLETNFNYYNLTLSVNEKKLSQFLS